MFINISNNYYGAGTNAYNVLINAALKHYERTNEPTCFNTFNYDTLLEKAYEHIISPIQEIDDYLKNEAIQIIKPHGSCNWVKVIDQYEIPKDHEVFLNENLSSHHIR